MADFVVHITPDNQGGYLATTAHLPGETCRGVTPEAAFDSMKTAAEKRFGQQGFAFAEMRFPARFTQEAAEQAKAAFERGETQQLETAFADLAGLDLAAWRQKVVTQEQASHS